jgi:hypothetical protein
MTRSPRLQLIGRIHDSSHVLQLTDTRGVTVPLAPGCAYLADAIESAFYQLNAPNRGRFVIQSTDGNGAAVFAPT